MEVDTVLWEGGVLASFKNTPINSSYWKGKQSLLEVTLA